MGLIQSKRKKGSRSRSRSPTTSQSSASAQRRRHPSAGTPNRPSPTVSAVRDSHASFSVSSHQSAAHPSTPFEKKIRQTIRDSPEEYNLYSDSFFLPQDWDMQDRWFSLHIGLKQLFGDNVEKTTLSRFVPGACIVDMACGNGPWLMDMATQHPECQFVGVETLPELMPSQLLLGNISFKIMGDLNDPLPFKDNSVDVMRMSGTLVRFRDTNWEDFYKRIYRALKPGGVFEMVEPFFAPKASIMVNSFVETLMAVIRNDNQDYDLVFKASSRLAASNFERIHTTKRTVHLGSDGRLAEQFIAIILRAFEAVQPHLAPRMGMDDDDYRQRVEALCAQCAQHDAGMDWYRISAWKPLVAS